jgi:hypothetical protein
MRAPRGDRLRILFGGCFARVPGQSGLVWLVLHWVLGLRRLGHQVLLIEPLDAGDLRPAGVGLSASANAMFFKDVVHRHGLGPDAALLQRGGRETVGASWESVCGAAAKADLLIDVAGGLAGVEPLERIGRRAYLDVDPGFTQLWQEVEGIDMRLGGYDSFVTVGLTLGSPESRIPTCGRHWIPTPQPVLLDAWDPVEGVERPALTTVANWRGYGSIRVGGVLYGQKAHSLRTLIDLPRRTAGRFDLALAIDPGETADLASLHAHGWNLLDPAVVAGTPETYRGFVRGSRGELGIAKSGYVEARCGWFSDRSACYLAAGRPVIAQDTGFGAVLPTGEGLFAFRTADDVTAALAALDEDYERQRRAARRVAAEHLAAEVVLPRLLARLAATSPPGAEGTLAEAGS